MSKFSADFVIFNQKKITLQNPLGLIIDYVPAYTEAPIIFPHKI
jgi:hypothetical protein